MALFIEAVGDAGVVQRAPIEGRRAQINARPGLTYRIVDENGAPIDLHPEIKRVGDDLIVDHLPGTSAVQINGFFTECTFDAPCSLSLKGLGGDAGESITPLSEPVAALADGAFIMKAPPSLAPELPTAPESEFPVKPVLLGVAALGLAGAGGGGGGGDTTVTEPVPSAPTVTSKSLTNDPTPVITGTSDPGSTIRLTLDIAGGQSVSFTTVADGSGNWSIDTGAATPVSGAMPTGGLPSDSVTNVLLLAQSAGGSSSSVQFSLTVDTTPPVAVATLDAITDDAPGHTGVLADGATTNDKTPTLSGSLSQLLSDGDVVHVLRDGVVVGTATVNGTQWTYTDSGLSDGATHHYVVRVEDAAGNASAASADFSIVTDYTAPAAPTIALIAGDDFVNAAEGRTASGSAPISVSGTAEAGSTVNVAWGPLALTTTAAADGSWTVTFDGNQIADGPYSVTATASDAAGNASDAASRSVQVLTGTPSTPTFLPVEGDNLVNATEASDGIVLSGTATAGTTVLVTFNGVERAATLTGTAWSLAIAHSDLPADGNYTATAFARDIAGNLSTVGSSGTITIDQTPPAQAVTITQATDNVPLLTGAVANNGLTNDQTPTIQGTVAGGLGAGESVVVMRDGTPIGTPQNSANWSVTDPGLTTQGAHVYTAHVVDTVGNVGPDSATFTLNFDGVRPATPTLATIAGNNAVDAAEAAAGVTVTGTAEAGGSVAVTWGATTLTGAVDGAGNWSVPFASGSIPADGSYNVSVVARDTAGNESLSAAQLPVSVDRTPPSVAITDSASGATNGPVTFTFTFSESVTGFAASDVTVANGTKGAFTAVDASHYTLVVTPSVASGAMTVDVGAGVAADAAGNGNTAAAQASVTIDQVPPTVAISDNVPGTASGDVTFTFTFSEPVTGFATGDITVSPNGTKGAFTAVDSTHYTLVVTPTPDTTGTLTVDVAAGAATDSAGNTSTAPAQYSQAFDTVVPPSVTIGDQTAAATTNGDIVFTFAFSEAVTGFTAGDVTLSPGATAGTFTTVDSSHYTLSVTPPAGNTGTVTADVAAGVATDLAGNPNLAATQHGQAYDTQAPSLLIDDNIASGSTAGPIVFSFAFSEAVTGFTAGDVTLSPGATAGAFSTVDSSHYTLSVTPPSGGTGTVTADVGAAAATDLAGNASLAATQHGQTYDTQAPTLTIDDNIASGTAHGAVVFSFAFSEAVTGFTAGDVTLSPGATAGTFTTVDSSHYTLAVTPPSASTGTLTADVGTAAASDLAGNASVAAAQHGQTYDTRTITISTIMDNDNTDGYTGPISNNNVAPSDDETPTLQITLNGALGGDSIHVYRDGVDIGSASAGALPGDPYTFTDSLNPAVSPHTYVYTAHIFNGSALVDSATYTFNFQQV